MQPHAQLWYRPDGTFYMPLNGAAVMRMSLESINKGWFPTSVKLCTLGELQFYHDAAVQYMDRIRIMPSVLAVSIHENRYSLSSEYEWGAVKRQKWHGHINWHATLAAVLETLRSELPMRVAGYDGSETPS